MKEWDSAPKPVLEITYFGDMLIGVLLSLSIFHLILNCQAVAVVEENAGGIDPAALEEEKQHLTPEIEEILVKQKKRYDCPLCDSSVFSYCSDKLLHDACCCLSPYETELPLQCKFADCSFLHANTCQEHRLITACCCSQLLYNTK